MDQIFENKCSSFSNGHSDSANALKFIVGVFVSDIYPLISRITYKFYDFKEGDDYIIKIRNIHLLCTDQIKKCYLIFVEIIKKESKLDMRLQESRQCILERILWCYKKLLSIEKHLESSPVATENFDNLVNDLSSLNSMYFVNWIDQTFDILNELSSIIYNVNNKSESFCNSWKNEIVECVCGLHSSIEELLLSAMTICKYCLPADNNVLKTRCQVVLRETKALLCELIMSDENVEFVATIDKLKLPIKPTNVNVLIDVLKDVLYVLETNTNTALLSLLVLCFSKSISPIDILRNHLKASKKACTCLDHDDDEDDVVEKCVFVKEFDLHNERIMQIGSFAMSCSSDQKRILDLRSGLASLEALDPHLVPALTLAPSGHHTTLLTDIWKQDIMQIRNNVFLIVDPSAFTEKAKYMMHQTLLEITKENCYNNKKSCEAINIGVLVYEFFSVYNECEPEALTHKEQLQPLLNDLFRAQMECKVVSDNLCSTDDFKYDTKKTIEGHLTLDKFIKRLKLLYTIVKRIHVLLNPEENDEEFYKEEIIENKTYTIDLENINVNTYVRSPKAANLTRSVFARTNNLRSPKKFILPILTKHLKIKQDLSFSFQLDKLCNISEVKRERSILYHSPIKTKSLRKAVLNRHMKPEKFSLSDQKMGVESVEVASYVDENTSLQITDILDQLDDLTKSLAVLPHSSNKSKYQADETILNRTNSLVTNKQMGNISINCVKDNDSVDVSQPSAVNTLERISDLDLVESKLSNLKFGQIETSL